MCFFVLLFINGMAQSLCWPCVCKVLGSWFQSDTKKKNTVFGVLGVSACAGSFLGTALTVFVADKYGWRKVYIPGSVITIFVAVFIVLFFRPPNFPVVIDSSKNSTREIPNSGGYVSNVKRLWTNKLVPEMCVSLFCVKTVRYIIQMWIPMYLLQHLGYSYIAAGLLSTAFDVGGILGSSFIGAIIDRFFQGDTLRGIGCVSMCCTVSLILCQLARNSGILSILSSALFLFVAGACNFGTDSILGGLLPYEIGERGGRNAGAATAGFVNGFGTLGGVLEGPVVGFVSGNYGWTAAFYLMIIVSALGVCTILRAWSIEKKTVLANTWLTEPTSDPESVEVASS